MQPETEIMTTWNPTTRKHYEELGYVFTKYNQPFYVKYKDIKQNGVIKVFCDVCGIERSTTKSKHEHLIKKFGKSLCIQCFNKNKTLDIDVVKSKFIEVGYTPLFDSYVKAIDKLPFLCNKHPMSIKYGRYSDLHQGNLLCKECKIESISGENSYMWKGGLSEISSYLRKRIRPWIQTNFMLSNVCALTNSSENLIVHHLNVSFSSLMYKTFDETGILKKSKVLDYDENELNILSEYILDLHYKYAKGIVLNKKVHNLFHYNYGTLKFTEYDFYIFCEQYVNLKI